MWNLPPKWPDPCAPQDICYRAGHAYRTVTGYTWTALSPRESVITRELLSQVCYKLTVVFRCCGHSCIIVQLVCMLSLMRLTCSVTCCMTSLHRSGFVSVSICVASFLYAIVGLSFLFLFCRYLRGSYSHECASCISA